VLDDAALNPADFCVEQMKNPLQETMEHFRFYRL
jgi:hypothetical protein